MLDPQTRERLQEEYTKPFHQIPFSESKKTYEVAGCSDILQITLNLSPEGEVSLYFAGEGCLLCLSSASLMCRLAERLTLPQLRELLKEAKNTLEKGVKAKTQDLKFLETFYEKPNRRHCVALAWEGLEQELEKIRL